MTLDFKAEEEIKTRLLGGSLEDKLMLQKKSGNNLVFCCVCHSGLTEENKPIYYSPYQMGRLDEKMEKEGIGKSHGYCKPCLRIEYQISFGIDYELT
jgi:hypothetical protein